ncbi:MAG: hypothetical protein PHD97_12015, partial [Bacteroidales bacterium]|nr:hypothetical protein [Bacteroidales bacterium]
SNNNKNLKYVWEVREESTDRKSGGDAEAEPPEVPGCIKNKGNNTILVKAPLKEGEYRLYVKVFGEGNKFCYANIPFYVKPADPFLPQPQKIKFKNYDLKSFENDNK